MALIDWVISSFANWVDKLQNGQFGRLHIATGTAAGVATLLVWLLHTTHPYLFAYSMHRGGLAKLLFLVAIVPPFLAAFCFGRLVFPTGASESNETGPLSAYLKQEAGGRKWRLMVVAAAVGAANFIVMMFTSY